uniref:SAM-dependent methyltransferase n=1 Tax=Dulem virus 36 TaxID=3145754 RepID=A0AAU8AZJ7_9CAUD
MYNRKYSTHIFEKSSIRQQAIQDLEHVCVLDCFHGKGEIWENMHKLSKIDKVQGIEKNKKLHSCFDTLYGDNLKLLKTIDIDEYNVIDLDAFGSPFKQMDIIFARAQKPKVIIYTFCFSGMSGVPQEISRAKNIQKKCKTIINGYLDEMFSAYLKLHGVTEWYDITIKQNLRKSYGYFIYDSKKDLTRNQ